MSTQIAEIYVAMRLSQERLLPDLREARGNISSAVGEMAGLIRGAFAEALGVVGTMFRAVPGGLLAPLATLVNAAATIGQDVAGAFMGVLEGLASGVPAIMGGAVKAAGGAIVAAGALALGATIGIVKGLPILAGGIVGAVSSIAAGFRYGLVDAVVGAAHGVAAASMLAMSGLSMALNLTTAAAAATVGGIVYLASFSSTVVSAAQTAYSAVTGAASSAISGISRVISAVTGPVMTAAGAVATAAGAVFMGLRAGALMTYGSVLILGAGIRAVGSGIVSALGTAFSWFGKLAGGGGLLLSGLGQAGAAIGRLASAALEMVSGAVNGIGRLAAGIVGFGVSVFRGIAGMASSILGGVVSFVSGVSGIVTGIFQSITGVISQAAKGISKILGDVLGAAGTIAAKGIELLARTIGSVLAPALSALSADLTDWASWTQEAIKAEAVMARMGALLQANGNAAGWSAAQIDVMIERMAAMGEHSIPEIQKAVFVLTQFPEVRALEFSAALAATRQLAAAMQSDLPAAANTLGRALENPEQGLRRLRQAHVFFTEEETKNIRWVQHMQGVAAAQDIVLAKVAALGNVAGAMAETMQGQVNRLRVTWESIGGAIGEAMMPLARIVVEFLQPIIGGFASTLKSFFGGVEDSSKGLLASAHAWIAGNVNLLRGWGQTLGEIVSGAINLIQTGFANLTIFLSKSLGGSADSLQQALADLPGQITHVLALINTMVHNFSMTWNIFKMAASDAFDYIKAKVPPVFDYLVDVAVTLFEKLISKLRLEFDLWLSDILHNSAWSKILGFAASEIDFLAPSAGIQTTEEGAREAHEQRMKAIAGDRIRAEERLRALQAAPSPEGANAVAIKNQWEEIKRLAAEAEAIAKNPPPPAPPRKKTGPEPDMTPKPKPQDMPPIKVSMTGLEDMWKGLQKSITGTSPEALAKMGVNATNGVRDSVKENTEVIKDMSGWIKAHSPDGGGFAA